MHSKTATLANVKTSVGEAQLLLESHIENPESPLESKAKTEARSVEIFLAWKTLTIGRRSALAQWCQYRAEHALSIWRHRFQFLRLRMYSRAVLNHKRRPSALILVTTFRSGNIQCDILRTKMNRLEFQGLAVERLGDADALLKAERYACAYYVSGYAIECALKACIARKTMQDDFPPREAPRYYIHDIPKLLDIAGLGLAFDEQARQDPILMYHWDVVKDWTEEARYQTRGQKQAEEILAAINDPEHGVLQWLRQNW